MKRTGRQEAQGSSVEVYFFLVRRSKKKKTPKFTRVTRIELHHSLHLTPALLLTIRRSAMEHLQPSQKEKQGLSALGN